ncbi:hypothetical protein, partial [Streptomyces sp. NRRL F-5135]|uniref:hypothetical protein n=1 Tax=Streptomyces sp. NRRL F-5135 TaxID=1463858 RepID=UPI0005612232
LAEADGFRYEGLEPHDYQRHVGAVLAVLPAPVDRAAVRAAAFEEAAAHYAKLTDQNEAYNLAEHGSIDETARLYEAVRDVVAGLRRLAGEAQQDEHVCKPGASLYYCPTAGEVESDCHGGFDVCCGRPDLHQSVTAHTDTADRAPCTAARRMTAVTTGPIPRITSRR